MFKVPYFIISHKLKGGMNVLTNMAENKGDDTENDKS